jgi:hypothetical protein
MSHTIFAHSTEPWDFLADFVRGVSNKHPVAIEEADRLYHLALLGKTGVGKSTLLLNLMYADLMAGRGFALLDPHGDLAEQLLDRVPRERIEDVVYFNPADLEFPAPFNIFEAIDEAQHHLIASGLVSIFKRFWGDEAIGPRSEYLLRNAVLALLETPGATLLDFPRLLTDEPYRTRITRKLKNPAVRGFWTQEYAGYSRAFREQTIAPIQNKVGEFLMTALTRNILGQRKNLFQLRSLMDEGKILIVNLSKGALGEDNAALLGSMMLTRIMLAAFTRQDIPENERRLFNLYVDEYPSFATEGTFSSMLSESRKYGLALTLSNQYLAQVSENMRSAIFGTIGTLIAFQLGREDAEYVAGEFYPVSPEQLTDLANHQIYLKLKTKGGTSPAFSASTFPPPPLTTSYRSEIVEHSRSAFARPRATVERRAPASP